MTIRVVHVISGLSTGGAEMMLWKLLSRTDRRRFDPVVVSLTSKRTNIAARIEELGVPVYALKMAPGRAPISGLWWLARMLQSTKPDVIQGWMYHGNLASCLGRLSSPRKARLLWNIRHSVHDLKHEKKLTAACIRTGALLSAMPARIIYNSMTSARQHESLGYSISRTVVIPNGFDCARFQPSQSARAAVRQEWNIAQSDIVIGLVGRYHPMKDHANFFKAAGMLLRKHENATFILAGRGVEWTNLELITLINRYGVINRTRLLGERHDIPRLTAGMDIASSSSYSEAFSNTIGEAMSCGVPCMVTDVGDSRWIVGQTGIVVPPRDAEALAQAWARLMEAGQDARLRLGEEARHRILANFSLDQIGELYDMHYEQLANSTGSSTALLKRARVEKNDSVDEIG